ncbi:MAG TPA: 4-hydroxy-3-methylbut-2-enyl diphosphate reductase [bacterium]|nr:4-hydroxy-3-methylbut-2-enyl diphosphate reductase [bacterium]
MQVIVGKSAGFCMGVRRAVNKVMELASENAGAQISVYGPLIHNRQVNEMLEKKRVKIAHALDEISPGICVIRTHGISPQKRELLKEKRVEICDATCPRVLAVQKVIEQHAHKGYFIVIVGDKGHAEVEGLMGFTGGSGIVVDSPEKTDEIPCGVTKVCVVAQTTQNHGVFKRIESLLRERYADCIVFDTICDSTAERQQEVLDLAGKVDAMVIVGGKESANTMRLVEISQAAGVPTFHVETEKEIDPRLFKGFARVGVSAGASTPNIIVHNVAKAIEAIA